MKTNRISVLLLSALMSMSVSAQKSEGNVKELVETFADRIEMHGYAQAGFTYKDNTNSPTNTYDVKRVLFWAKAKITDRWSFLFMHDFSSVVQEFYTDYKVCDALNIRFGQFKNSCTMENPLSPTKLELIECYSQAALFYSGCGSDPLYGVQYGRDLGMRAYGMLFNNHLYYELSIMNGQGINRKDGNKQKDVQLMLDYRPVNGLRIVATGQKGKGHAINTSVYNPDIQVGDDYTRDRVSFGAELKSKPISLRSEYMAGKDGDVNSWGYYCTGSAPIYKKLEAIASFDYFERNTKLDMDHTNYTAGIQYWFYNKCRAQIQYTRCCPGTTDNYNCIQAQMQIAF